MARLFASSLALYEIFLLGTVFAANDFVYIRDTYTAGVGGYDVSYNNPTGYIEYMGVYNSSGGEIEALCMFPTSKHGGDFYSARSRLLNEDTNSTS